MDNATCHVVYVNRQVRQDRLIRNDATDAHLSNGDVASGEVEFIQKDAALLLDTFGEVYLCSTGSACISTLFQLSDESMMDLTPTLVLVDVPYDERLPKVRSKSRSPSPHSRPVTADIDIHTPEEEVYGLKLLQRIMTEAHLRSISKLVVPIPVVSFSSIEVHHSNGSTIEDAETKTSPTVDRRLIIRCLDLGAVDVIISPLHPKCVTSLEIHAYRGHKEAAREQQEMLEVRRGRKRSWVGVNEEKPFAYLREAMVSGLMRGICRSGADSDDDRIANVSIAVSTDRQAAVAAAVGKWHFCAHSWTDDELLVAAMVMFKHALTMPELDRWRIPTDQLISFLVACRAAYNNFVPYHNFRHVVDVLQATFHFLVRIGTLAPFPQDSLAPEQLPEKSPMASLLHPFEGLTLLITAIGHDVGHPGVNNGFLVTLNAPLAQLYNDRSVLESFHCAAYSQILRRYWPSAFEDTKMRNLMISSILATDMGLHFDYMKKLGDTQEKLDVSNTTDGWNGRMLEEQKALACSLLIKCADISNVARKHETALKWMHILSDEFSRQASMENELDIASSLLAPPKKDLMSLSKAQLSFMNMFAIPLFQGVADILPAMRYTVDELEINKGLFEQRVRDEQAKEDPVRKRLLRDGTFSPRTMSFVGGPESQRESMTPRVSTPLTEELATPPSLLDESKWEDKELSPGPADPVNRPTHVPDTSDDYKEVNGIVTTFDSVADFAASDPFHSRDRASSSPDNHHGHNGKQRCSETTDGSITGQYGGDWASQATSATTGKMPLSPSTQGTSIVSAESAEHIPGVPTISEPKPFNEGKLEPPMMDQEANGSYTSHESCRVDGGRKLVKKKSSRFRIKAFNFFRGTRSASPSMPAADTAG
ncbi:3' 5'-cyclic-nucleotide phosphodiesterase 2 [Colletotrichum gloeosporioides]|uniref:Phosphodiesterase n=1 Tax=Colletotrichum gloeosporioides TaxID=474922 RepID=A0A8H4CM37_COLGL|nr:3' 5'-cyclic-nucleotide phosphodiesterase 2 [Colletotrichum gloeosporioides]KAF3806410.1 3' 5'-cyclic-nucleotide phosphodiesterase 2 [Colletotrichum gloeosporioides]